MKQLSDRRLKQIAKQITYRKGWRLTLSDASVGKRPYIQWSFMAACTKTGKVSEVSSRKWLLSRWMTESELVYTAYKAALAAEEHESREFFRYQGKRILNPHLDVKALMKVCEQEDARA